MTRARGLLEAAAAGGGRRRLVQARVCGASARAVFQHFLALVPSPSLIFLAGAASAAVGDDGRAGTASLGGKGMSMVERGAYSGRERAAIEAGGGPTLGAYWSVRVASTARAVFQHFLALVPSPSLIFLAGAASAAVGDDGRAGTASLGGKGMSMVERGAYSGRERAAIEAGGGPTLGAYWSVRVASTARAVFQHFLALVPSPSLIFLACLQTGTLGGEFSERRRRPRAREGSFGGGARFSTSRSFSFFSPSYSLLARSQHLLQAGLRVHGGQPARGLHVRRRPQAREVERQGR